jgi:hypothetical protein
LGFLSAWFFIWCVWVHFDFGFGFDYGFSFCAGEYLFLGLFFWDEDMMDGWMRVRRYWSGIYYFYDEVGWGGFLGVGGWLVFFFNGLWFMVYGVACLFACGDGIQWVFIMLVVYTVHDRLRLHTLSITVSCRPLVWTRGAGISIAVINLFFLFGSDEPVEK